MSIKKFFLFNFKPGIVILVPGKIPKAIVDFLPPAARGTLFEKTSRVAS
jgi:hypothetical protein